MKKVIGLTLFELLVALSLISVLVALAIPAFSHFVSRQRADADIRRVYQALHFSRVAAVDINAVVSLCPANEEGSSCARDWAAGMIAFVDANADGRRQPEERLLRYFAALADSSTLQWRAFGSRFFVRFRAEGAITSQNGSFTYCGARNDARYARQVVVARTGRPRFAIDSNNDDILEDAAGNNISCPA